MTTKRLPLIALTAIALASAAPAGAVSSYPVFAALHPVSLTASTGKASSGKYTKHTCQAGRDAGKDSGTTGTAERHTIPVVACEQPPRSQLVLPSLAKAAVAALDAIG